MVDKGTTEVAKQITDYEFRLFRGIPLYELLNQGWLKKDKEENSPNLLTMIRFSNTLSTYLASAIVSEDNLKKRVNYVEFCIELAQQLFNTNNFNGCLEVLAALGNSAVARLKLTWEKIDRKLLVALEEMRSTCASDDNFKRYRYVVLNAPPPKLPYVGLILTDLVYIEEGNPKLTADGQINFGRCEKIAECLQLFKLNQDVDLKPASKDVIEFVNSAVALDEKAAYKRSLEIEPRI